MRRQDEGGSNRLGSIEHRLKSYEEAGKEEISRYSYYLLIFSIITFLLTFTGFLNGYYHFMNVASYYRYEKSVLSPLKATGYVTMFLVLCFFPVSDYVLIPFYGYLSSLGYFNVYLTLMVVVGSMMFIAEIEYFGGRFAGRAILLKALSYFRIKEKDIEVADRWLARHGPFSIFMSTFVPYFRNVTSLAAGTLEMNAGYYAISNLVGYLLRALFLLYLGYTGLDVLTPSFDYRYRLPLLFTAIFMVLMIAMTALMMHETRSAPMKRGAGP